MTAQNAGACNEKSEKTAFSLLAGQERTRLASRYHISYYCQANAKEAIVRILMFILAMILIFPLTACNESGNSKSRIGIVDLNRIMRECDMGKAGLKLIEEQQKKMQAELDTLQDKVEKNPADENAIRQLQQVYGSAQQKMQAEAENTVAQIFDVIQTVMAEYRQQHGYDVLLRVEAADSFSPSLDVSSAIMQEVNKRKIDFKPLPASPEGVPASASGDKGDKKDTAKPDQAADAKNKPDAPRPAPSQTGN